MKKLYVRAETEKELERLSTSLPQSLLLSGPSGVGLKTLAIHIAKAYGGYELLSPSKRTKTSSIESISIEQIRELYLRTRSKRKDKQIIVIDDADTMSLPAQNSFLKLLEEPNSAVHFILTSHHPELLLPTIMSRLRAVNLSPLSQSETDKLIITEYPEATSTRQAQLRYISSGLPAEISRLMDDETYFERRSKQMQLVKVLLEGTRYNRLRALYRATLSKPDTLELIDRLLLVLRRDPKQSSIRLLTNLLDAYEYIQANGNPRLQLTNAMV